MSRNSIYDLLTQIYDADIAEKVDPRIRSLIKRYHERIPPPLDSSLSERDSILITYGDQIRLSGHSHLSTLTDFCKTYLPGVVSGVHILPFFPWSSDDGFSVKDYRAVDTSLGDWSDIEHLGQSFRLMFDGVINHASAQGDWFQAFLRNEVPYRDYFLTVAGNPDLSKVIRPRTLPLITEYQTTSGIRNVWTTFSADQVDLNFQNPDVLLEIFDVLLMYAERGAQFIRLDAIAYLWKEIGTTCLHLPQVHAVIQLLRAVLDETAPHVRIITETNVPHRENISYFGNGNNEAQLVYNFALPPLVLHTFRTGDATALSGWAAGLDLPSSNTTYFNFLASHDGIGLNPAREILSASDIDELVKTTRSHGGLISLKQNSDGTQSPYEMNINFFDALSDPACDKPLEIQIDRFMAAQAIMLSLRGVPGIYFHSLFGSRGWKAGYEQTGQNRTINRQKLDRLEIESELSDRTSLRSRVFGRFRLLLNQRASSSAFHPNGGQTIEDHGKGIFAVVRSSPGYESHVLCLQNVTAQTQITGEYRLKPYQILWVKKST